MTSYDAWKTTDPNESAMTGSDALDVLTPGCGPTTPRECFVALVESLPSAKQDLAWQHAFTEVYDRFMDDLLDAAEDALRSGVEEGEASQCDA